MDSKNKFCSIRMPKEIHKMTKLEAYRRGKTIQDFILNLVLDTLKPK